MANGSARGQFLSVEGIDGAGKTTLCAALAAKFPVDLLTVVDRKQVSDSSPYAARSMAHLRVLLWDLVDEGDFSHHYWVRLQATWFTAHYETVVEPRLARGVTVLVDGWYFKLWANLLNQGYPDGDLRALFSSVREPDSVILLDVEPSVAFHRKTDLRPAELGLYQGGENGDAFAGFCRYQGRARQRLLELAAARRWDVIRPTRFWDVDAVVDHVIPRISLQLAPML